MGKLEYFYWDIPRSDKLFDYEDGIIKRIFSHAIKKAIIDMSQYRTENKSAFLKILRHFNKPGTVIECLPHSPKILSDVFSSLNQAKVKFIIDVSSFDHRAGKDMILHSGISLDFFSFHIKLNQDNYYLIDYLIDEFTQNGVTNLRISIQEYGPNKLSCEQIHDLIIILEKAMNRSPSARFEFIRNQNMILNENKRKQTNSIYLDNNGFVGAYSFLPTYNEHIFYGDIFELWNRYIELYLQNDISYYIKKSILGEDFDNKEELKEFYRD